MPTRTVERTRTIPRPLTLPAQPLAQLAALWWRVHEYPQDRAAKIQLALARKEGLDRCPSCRQPLSLDGYRATTTSYLHREIVACKCCHTQWLLKESHAA